MEQAFKTIFSFTKNDFVATLIIDTNVLFLSSNEFLKSLGFLL